MPGVYQVVWRMQLMEPHLVDSSTPGQETLRMCGSVRAVRAADKGASMSPPTITAATDGGLVPLPPSHPHKSTEAEELRGASFVPLVVGRGGKLGPCLITHGGRNRSFKAVNASDPTNFRTSVSFKALRRYHGAASGWFELTVSS
jgi:hypothetical protein